MRVGPRSLAAVALLIAIFRPPTASGQDPKAVLEEVRDRHRTALEAIRTVAYSYNCEEWKSEMLHFQNVGPAPVGGTIFETGPGQYWQSPDTFRTRALWSDGSTVDVVFRFGRLLRAKTAKENDPDRTLKITLETCSIFQCVWRSAILFEHLSRHGSEFLPFHGLLQQPHQIRSVERLPAKSGERLGEIRVELAHDHGAFEFWFDPNHNYLIRKLIEHRTTQPHHRYECEVSEFTEPDCGQFFPARIDYRTYERGELKQHSRRNLSDVQINRPIPNEAFRIPGIEGGWCEDLTMRVGFRVDADGYRIGDTQPLPSPIAADRVSSRNPAPPPTRTDWSVPFWVGAVAAVLALCLCAALIEIRELRAKLKKNAIPK